VSAREPHPCTLDDGYIAHAFSACGCVTVYIAADQGIDQRERYAVVCQTHSNIVSARNKRFALSAMRDPDEWCEDCRAQNERDKNGDIRQSDQA
jgi:hypothetical protein